MNRVHVSEEKSVKRKEDVKKKDASSEMQEERTELEMDELLEILGNETRRKILELLTHEPLYVSQLSKILGVYPKAIERHLEKLKEAGLIEECVPRNVDPDDRMARRRIYYRVKRNLMISVGIGPNQFRLTIIEPKINANRTDQMETVFNLEIGGMEDESRDDLDRLTTLETQSDHLHQLKREILQLRQIDARIKQVEQYLGELMAVRQQVTQKIESFLNEEFEHLDFYARQILRELLENPMGTSIQELSQLYNVGLQTINDALEQLEREKLIMSKRGRDPRNVTELIRLLLFDEEF